MRLANELALDRPRFWEYLLTEELLRMRLAAVRKRLTDLDRGLIFQRNRNMRGSEFMNYVQAKFTDLKAAVEMIKVTVLEEIPAAWGPPGVSGDPLRILDAVNKIGSGCAALVDWEADLISVHPPLSLANVRDALRGSTKEIVDEIAPFPDLLADGVRKAREHTGTEPLQFPINFVFRFSRSETICKACTDATTNFDPNDW
jgi:hypothetical protein